MYLVSGRLIRVPAGQLRGQSQQRGVVETAVPLRAQGGDKLTDQRPDGQRDAQFPGAGFDDAEILVMQFEPKPRSPRRGLLHE